ncbi:ketoacyl-ACP synthase III [Pendulispora rubella]|uniref:Ketoacyl-ACP synthase III n=1 Tax=Pendulispora rubella TaxID=2741070 RepID=A0ABZ2LJ14_9BACT
MNAPKDRARIVAIGTHIPSRRISNVERAPAFKIDPTFLENKIGVLERSIKDESEAASDLCVKAFHDLTEKTPIDLGSIKLACVVTQNPDRRVPHTAAIVHQKLGLEKSCATFDISQGCAGYTHGLAITTALLETLAPGKALLFTCDPYSTIVDPNDKGTALIFGDAASVSVLSKDEPGYALIDSDFGTAPNSYECLIHDGQRLNMDGRQVFSHAAREVPQSIQRVLERNGLSTREVDRFLLHPGSKYIIDFLRGALGLDATKVPFEIERYGNTVSSSIPILLKENLRRNRDARVVLSGFGVGFSWGTNLIELQP